MKTIVAIIATAAVTLAATYGMLFKRQTALREQIERLQSQQLVLEDEKHRLEKDVKAARNQPVRSPSVIAAPQTAAVAASSGRSPEQILEHLKGLRLGTGAKRTASVRQVVHQLESLVEHGPNALPVIREFLARFEDVDYGMEPARQATEASQEQQEGDKRAEPAMPGMARNQAKLDFLFPPSLRIGLVDVLKSIGGESAEPILAEMLSTSGRAVEVAYVARTLQDMAPDKYKDTALAAAKDLLANPLSPDRPNALDENAKSYLYAIMAMYNDPSFSVIAKALLINAEGQLDRTALTYLTSTMKEHAVPALYEAYKDPRVTNLWEKASIAGQALNYAGSDTQANKIFNEIVVNESMPSWMRAMTIQTLAGGTFFGGSAPADPNQIQARLTLLKNLPEFKDERMAQARTEAIQRLTDRLEGKTETPASTGAAGAESPFPAPGAGAQ